VRGERGGHHVARVDGRAILLEFLADELKEGRSGDNHARRKVEDVERRAGTEGEETQTGQVKALDGEKG
jgi:hypothetical protein